MFLYDNNYRTLLFKLKIHCVSKVSDYKVNYSLSKIKSFILNKNADFKTSIIVSIIISY